MRAITALRRNVLFGLLTLLLSAQVSGAHLHLCFDGQEPPVQLHVLDDAGEDHHDSDLSQPHTDEDVALNDGSSPRDKPLQLDLPPASAGMFPFDPRPATVPVASHRSDNILLFTARDELLPPSRGPPENSRR